MSTVNDPSDTKFRRFIKNYESTHNAARCGSVGDGWVPILEECFDQLNQIGWKGDILQIKEKFGALRIYVSAVNELDKVNEIISIYENRSRSICEECGAPGKTVTVRGWLRTACQNHSEGAKVE